MVTLIATFKEIPTKNMPKLAALANAQSVEKRCYWTKSFGGSKCLNSLIIAYYLIIIENINPNIHIIS